jgi:hypothetical protein
VRRLFFGSHASGVPFVGTHASGVPFVRFARLWRAFRRYARLQRALRSVRTPLACRNRTSPALEVRCVSRLDTLLYKLYMPMPLKW